MEALAHEVEEFDVRLSSGRLHAARFGGGARLVLCVPGLSANIRCFDFMGARLAAGGFQVVALDLRGRGRSETTPAGTYGWPAHAADVAEVAHRLGAEAVQLVGWSMGAFVALQLASVEPQLIQRVALVDACGPTSKPANALIRSAIDRLGVVHPSIGEYIELVRRLGIIVPWDPLWQRYFEYELEPVGDGVKARTSRQAVTEDFDFGISHDPRRLWSELTMPVLLVRAALPLVPRGPFVVSEADRDAFAESVPTAEVVEVDANHYGVVTDPRTADAILEFLEGRDPRGGL